VIACRLLLGPHVIQRGSRIFTEPAFPGVMIDKNQGIEYGFCSARLGDLMHVAIVIGVVRSDFAPTAYARDDILDESAFTLGGRLLVQRLT
jgi:hypothetical protein